MYPSILGGRDFPRDAPHTDDAHQTGRVALLEPKRRAARVIDVLGKVKHQRGGGAEIPERDAGPVPEILADNRLGGRHAQVADALRDERAVGVALRDSGRVVDGDVRRRGDHRHREGRAVAFDHEAQRLVRARADELAHGRPLARRDAVDRDDDVARSQARERRGALGVAWRALAVRVGRGNASTDGAHDGLGDGDAVDRGDRREEDDGDDEIHDRAAEHHDDLLPPREAVEGPMLLAGQHLLDRTEPGVLDHARRPAGAPHRPNLVRGRESSR